ncbi:MAG: TIGR01777 family protein [Bryobacterales bacterium]|nr:TIGR01777 family protein [Bryobacterales bacterium]
MRITLTGATGFLGTELIGLLQKDGYDLRFLSRKAAGGPAHFAWDPVAGPPPAASLEGADAVIYLAGEPVAQRWTDEVKRKIRLSRVQGTNNLVAALRALPVRPKTLICASAIGYYGSRGADVLTESAAAGTGFLPEVCVEWEQAAGAALALGMRVVTPRIGVVLGKEGGALKKMLPPFRLGIGGPLAGGRQWMSWIHVEDMVRLIAFAVNTQALDGAVNAVSPEPVTNAGFTRELGAALHRPTFFPVPEFALRALYGEMAGILLDSQRAIPAAAQAAGFQFLHPNLAETLRGLL